jgi:periplasmic protein CpxP/Spy
VVRRLTSPRLEFEAAAIYEYPEHLRSFLNDLPTRPGVYLFHGESDTTTAAPADAKPMMHHKGKFGPHQDMMFKDLNLTDAQKQQIREIMKGQRDQMKRPPLEERRAMHDIIASDTFDKAKAEAQIAKMEEQRKANMLAHMETQNKIYNILTPEQKKQFNANFEKRLTERPAAKGKMPATAE